MLKRIFLVSVAALAVSACGVISKDHSSEYTDENIEEIAPLLLVLQRACQTRLSQAECGCVGDELGKRVPFEEFKRNNDLAMNDGEPEAGFRDKVQEAMQVCTR